MLYYKEVTLCQIFEVHAWVHYTPLDVHVHVSVYTTWCCYSVVFNCSCNFYICVGKKIAHEVSYLYLYMYMLPSLYYTEGMLQEKCSLEAFVIS